MLCAVSLCLNPLLTDEKPPVIIRLFVLYGWLKKWLLAYACYGLKQVCPEGK